MQDSSTASTIPVTARDGDVFGFAYSQESWDRAKSGLGHGDLHWAFDGQLIYRDGLLCDTYWGLEWRGDSGRSFTVADAQAKGELVYVCNLNDVEKIPDYDYELYAGGDAFNLSYQHGCYRHFVRRKGARKDKDRMTEAVHRKVQEARDELDRAVRRLEWAVLERERKLAKIEAGEEVSAA